MIASCAVQIVECQVVCYYILNEFQKGSHMAAVTKVKPKTKESFSDADGTMNQKPQETQRNGEADLEKGMQDESSTESRFKKVGEVIGIITLEDVMEELLQVRLFNLLNESQLSPLFTRKTSARIQGRLMLF